MPRKNIDDSLTAIPALIDPHVHFRTPGAGYKEDWKFGALAAISGGITTVLDMPNNAPSTVTLERIEAKEKLIDAQLRAIGIPLRYGLYLGASEEHLAEISGAKGKAVAIKVFMGSTTGDLLLESEKALEEVFQRSKEAELLIAFHAEKESVLKELKANYRGPLDTSNHSRIRDRSAAIAATCQIIELCAKYNTPAYILHVTTQEEVALIRQAKSKNIPIYAEACLHHLFLTEKDSVLWKNCVKVNPPLRAQDDQDALWEGIHDGTIDTIGSDHAPHTWEEKQAPYEKAPSGIPGVELILPLLLNAVSKGVLTLQQLITLTRTNPEKIFSLPPNDDVVLVDLEFTSLVRREELKTKCGWSPYVGRELTGWPIYTILKGKRFPACKYAEVVKQGRFEEKLQTEKNPFLDPQNAYAKSYGEHVE